MGDEIGLMRGRLLRLLAPLLLVGLVAACGGDDGDETDVAQEASTTTAAPDDEAATEPGDDTAECADLGASVKVAIPNPQIAFTPPIIARDSGIFADYGLEVEVINMAAPNMPAALVSNDIQFAAPVSTVAKAALQGIPVKGVFVAIEAPANAVVANKSLTSPQDLKGKRLVTGPLPSGPGITAAWTVESLGLEVGADVELVPISDPAARHGMVVQGQAEAVVMDLDAAYRALRDNPDLHILIPREDVPSYGGTGLGVSEAYLQDEPETVSCMVRAMAATLRFIEEEEEEVTSIVAEILQLEDDEAPDAYQYYLDEKTENGVPSDDFLQREVDAAIRSGVPDATLEQIREAYDVSIAEEISDEG